MYVIRDWATFYETHETRKLKRLQWIPLPTHRDSEGYATLTAGEHGAANLGAWVAILQVAASCRVRGRLSRSDGTPLDSEALSAMTRITAADFDRVLPLLCSMRVGWVFDDKNAISPETTGEYPDEAGKSPARRKEGIEWKEGKTDIQEAGCVLIPERLVSPDIQAAGACPHLRRVAVAYPKPNGHRAAYRIWATLIAEGNNPSELADRCVAKIEEYKKSKEWEKDRGAFVPDLASWLDKGRWDDAPTPSKKVSTRALLDKLAQEKD